MILVVEGISASGKSTWCAQHCPHHTIADNGTLRDAPDRDSDPIGTAKFWAERNVDRWQTALTMESKASFAVCDTDPLKLHYIWSLWQIGEATERDWLLQLAATRDTVVKGLIGFADRYVISEIEANTARDRARGDATRRRRNLELHVRLRAALLTWYSALDRVLPGRVEIGLPPAMPAVVNEPARYGVANFDRLIDGLPHELDSDRPILAS